MKQFLIAVFFLVSCSASAQKTISGYITSAESGEALINASVFSVNTKEGTVANQFGYYSLTIDKDSADLIYSYVGCIPTFISINLKHDTTINISIAQAALLEEVVVTSEQGERAHETSRMSTINIPIQKIRSVPVLMGEPDIMKVLQLLPGIQAGSEGSSGLYVRGGGQDQNLILLDGVPVYNASHLYGFFSTFNPDAINHVEVTKGGFPARYGGRLSSVVDINMKEGNQKEYHAQFSIGLISSRLYLEGPIIKNKTSFSVSARRSYLNLLQGPILNKQTNPITDGYFFYDLNAKINHRINQNNRLYFSVYNGLDRAASNSDNNYETETETFNTKTLSHLQWGNTIAAVRWNHIFGSRLFSNLTTTFSKYQFNVSNKLTNTTSFTDGTAPVYQTYSYNYKSGIRDFAIKDDFEFIINPSNYLRFGAQIINHHFTPGVLALSSDSEASLNSSSGTAIDAKETSAYIEDEITFNEKLSVNAGIHTSSFFLNGKTYSSLQPRVSGKFSVRPDLSIKLSYASMAQFIHLLSNSGLGLPTDLWVPATQLVKPQTSKQVALGGVKTFNHMFEISIESYYKTMNNLIEYKDGASYLDASGDWQNKVESGIGRSFGVELFAEKKTGKLTGWIGYTISKTERQFVNINQGNWFPYRYDRRHDAKVNINYKINSRLESGVVWVYGTGNAVTVPLDWYQGATANNTDSQLFGDYRVHYENRNGFRMRSYHRMDISVTYLLAKNRFEHRLNVSVYNVYNRANPFYLEFGFKDNQRVLKQVSLFPVLPSITYSIKM